MALDKGFHELRAPAWVDCYLTVGPLATLRVTPSRLPGDARPVESGNTIKVAGTMETVLLTEPEWRSFAMVLHNSLVWDKHVNSSVFRVLLDDYEHPPQQGWIARDVPEKTRLLAVTWGGEQDQPDIIDLVGPLACAKCAMEEYTVLQLRMGTEDCLNKCIQEKNAQCTPDEMERLPWPPQHAADKPADNTNTTMSFYYNSLFNALQLKADPATRSTIAGGALAGAIASLLVFAALYPPRAIARLCCCRKKQHYDHI
jgi:hypothetical protein